MTKTVGLIIAGIIIIVLLAGGWYLYQQKKYQTEKVAQVNFLKELNVDKLPGIQKTPAPWPLELNRLRDRLTQLNLPALTAEGVTLHTHQHLDLYVNGQKISIPDGIGNNESQGFISPIHTHDSTGVIHVESPRVQPFFLGQFFDIWGLRLTDSCLGGYCNSGNKKLRLYSNGQFISHDLAELELQAYQEIMIVYGTEKETPPVITGYSFPVGD